MSILTNATTIRNETVPRANTATRVGDVLIEIANEFPFVNVQSVSDLPTAVGGVITLEADTTYIIDGNVDLGGSRLVCGGVTNLFGMSSETSSLTSTGLGASTPLITSAYTIIIRSLNIKDVGTALSIDGTSRTVAIDWYGVNFTGVEDIGTVNTVDNFIYESGAFLSSNGLKFTGTIGTIGFNNSLFVSNGEASNVIELTSSCTITRRFRVIYSSFVVTASSVGVDVDVSATIPDEGYILDTVNFSGGGTYITGITNSDKALFRFCRGIANTNVIGNMYIVDNSTATVVSEAGVRYAIAGTSTASASTQRFTHSDATNTLNYDSSISRLMVVTATFSLKSGNNDRIGVYLGKTDAGNAINPTVDYIDESEVYVTTNGLTGSDRPVTGTIQALVNLDENDKIYGIVQNTTDTDNIVVEFFNLIVQKAVE